MPRSSRSVAGQGQSGRGALRVGDRFRVTQLCRLQGGTARAQLLFRSLRVLLRAVALPHCALEGTIRMECARAASPPHLAQP